MQLPQRNPFFSFVAKNPTSTRAERVSWLLLPLINIILTSSFNKKLWFALHSALFHEYSPCTYRDMIPVQLCHHPLRSSLFYIELPGAQTIVMSLQLTPYSTHPILVLCSCHPPDTQERKTKRNTTHIGFESKAVLHYITCCPSASVLFLLTRSTPDTD